MSTCANIFVLFSGTLTDARIAGIEEALSNRTAVPVDHDEKRYGRLHALEHADDLVEISDDGFFQYQDKKRDIAPTITSLQGRFFHISYVSRWWDKIYPEGPAIFYSLTMLWLMSQADVEGVWYTSDSYSEGDRYPRMSKSEVHQMIDDFVTTGDITNDRPTRYIRAVDGSIISV